jgi:hypothetical protein
VDLNEAAQRIFKYHWPLILLTTLIGLLIPVLLVQGQDDEYAASARIVMGSTDAKDGQEANALADTALALATSPGVLTEALETAGVQRDESDVSGHVRVDPVGTSGVLQLSVTDADAKASASIAKALAEEIVQRREAAILGDTEALLAETDERIAALTANVAAIEAEADAAAQADAQARARGLNPGSSSLGAISLRHSQAVEELSRAQNQRQDLALSLAGAVRPAVIDASETAGTLVETGLAARVAIGGLLGLILGIALAATLEAWRPNLSPAGLARHLGVPLLGKLKRLPRLRSDLDNRWLTHYVSLAADGAGVHSFEVVPLEPGVDVTGLARSLTDDGEREVGRDIVPVALDGRDDNWPPSTWARPDTGIVVVAPRKVKSAWIANLERHVHLTRQPVIGVIGYGHRARTGTVGSGTAPSAPRRRTEEQDPAPTAAVTS